MQNFSVFTQLNRNLCTTKPLNIVPTPAIGTMMQPEIRAYNSPGQELQLLMELFEKRCFLFLSREYFSTFSSSFAPIWSSKFSFNVRLWTSDRQGSKNSLHPTTRPTYTTEAMSWCDRILNHACPSVPLFFCLVLLHHCNHMAPQ